MKQLKRADYNLDKSLLLLSKYTRSQENSKIVDYIKSISEKGTWTLNDPLFDDVSYCVRSHTYHMSNIITFYSERTNNVWYLLQFHCFVDIIATKDGYFCLHGNINQQMIVDTVGSLDFKVKQKKPLEFGGLLLSQSRPFHYFFDQLKNVTEIKNKIPDISINYNKKNFWTVENKLNKVDVNKFYLYPTLTAWYKNFIGKDQQKLSSLKQILLNDVSQDHRVMLPNSDLNIWFSITGQRRSWIEQIDGISLIVKELNKYFPKINVLLDGWTNWEGDSTVNVDDDRVAKKIKANFDTDVYKEKINIVSLVSKTYKDKLKFALECDYHVSDAGTGCFIPMFICGLNGVLHSNYHINSFFVESDSRTTIINTPEQGVKDVPIDGKASIYTSYSICWERVFNALADKINSDKKTAIETLIPPSLDESLEQLSAFRSLINGMESYESVVILREVALSFEKIGDTLTAEKIMYQAHLQNPFEHFYNKKLKEWSALNAPEPSILLRIRRLTGRIKRKLLK